jgi:hypothetical protein
MLRVGLTGLWVLERGVRLGLLCGGFYGVLCRGDRFCCSAFGIFDSVLRFVLRNPNLPSGVVLGQV